MEGYWYCPTCACRVERNELTEDAHHSVCGKVAHWMEYDEAADQKLREAFCQLGVVVEEMRKQVFALQCSMAMLEEQREVCGDNSRQD